MKTDYLESVKKQFEYYKLLGDKTIAKLPEEKLFWKINDESNSVATIVKHLNGNMMSRWTNFLTTDGEKEWRQRDGEFENDIKSKEIVLEIWEEGWECLFNTLSTLKERDLNKIVYIRNMGQTVIDAINRQLAHYPYHLGQMVYIGKMVCGNDWNSLSIPKGKSRVFNSEKFSKPKHNEHFTEEFLKNK